MNSNFIAENWKFLQENLWPSPLMFGIFLCSLVVLAFDRKKSAKKIFWYSLILLLAVVYNPYFWNVFVNRIYKGDELVQLRLPWMIPAFLIMAYSMCRIVFRVKKLAAKVFLAFAFLLVIRLAGVPFHPDVLVEKQNAYKISQEAKKAADDILQDMKDNPENLEKRPELLDISSTDVNDDVTPGNSFYYGIRQYTSDFTLASAIVPADTYEESDFYIWEYYDKPKQYLTYEIGADPIGIQAAQFGYHKISQTEDHVILRYYRKATVYLVMRGQTEADVSGKLFGINGDTLLTAQGWWRIMDLGRELKDVRFSVAYSSGIGQAPSTADIILRMNQGTGRALKAIPVANLNDISWGTCEGWNITDVITQYGEAALSDGAIDDETYVSPIGAENRYNAAARFDSGMGDTVKALGSDGQNVLVVANPSIIWWIQKYVEGGQQISELAPGYCIKLDFTDGIWSIDEVVS